MYVCVCVGSQSNSSQTCTHVDSSSDAWLSSSAFNGVVCLAAKGLCDLLCYSPAVSGGHFYISETVGMEQFHNHFHVSSTLYLNKVRIKRPWEEP